MTEDEQEKILVEQYLAGVAGFVEVGANHPIHGSQTWHLEQRGWRGILVEPQSALCESLRVERPEAFVVRAACTSPQQVGSLTLHVPSLSGFATLEPNKDDFYVEYAAAETVLGRTLDDIIQEWRATSSLNWPIRFVSIDVEGHELDVLKGFSLETHRPDLMLIEDKLQDLSKHRYLRARGYRLVRRTCMNNWYIPVGALAPQRTLMEEVRLFRKVFLGLPFRSLRRWRHRRRLRGA